MLRHHDTSMLQRKLTAIFGSSGREGGVSLKNNFRNFELDVCAYLDYLCDSEADACMWNFILMEFCLLISR